MLAAVPARASGVIELRDCAALDEAALEKLLLLELRTLQVPTWRFVVVVSCVDTFAIIHVTAAGGVSSEVRVDLSTTTPEAQNRLVALAASELIAQTERGEPDTVEPASTRAERVAPGRPAPTPLPPRRSPILFAGASAGRSGRPGTLLGGVLLGTQLRLPTPWLLSLETRYERGTTETSIASVDWALLTATLWLAIDLDLEPWSVALGPALRGGWVALDAEAFTPNHGQRLTGPWLGTLGTARAWLALSVHWRPFIGLEGGCVIYPVRGTLNEGPILVETGGCFLGGAAGIGYVF